MSKVTKVYSTVEAASGAITHLDYLNNYIGTEPVSIDDLTNKQLDYLNNYIGTEPLPVNIGT